MIIKVKPDIEKVKSMLRLTERREESILFLDPEKFSTIVVEMYYEVIKELSSILILIDGFKSVGETSHKDLIDFLLNYKAISDKEIILIHDLRIKRNNSMYSGKEIDKDYIKYKRGLILQIIKKLKSLINKKLNI